MKLPQLPFSIGRSLAVLLLAGFGLGLYAGDCSGPDDCGAIPDNATKAACGGAIIAGYCFITRSRKKEPETIEGEGDATDMDDAFGGSGGGDSSGGAGASGGGDSRARRGPPDGPLGDPNDFNPGGAGASGGGDSRAHRGPPDGPLGDPNDLNSGGASSAGGDSRASRGPKDGPLGDPKDLDPKNR